MRKKIRKITPEQDAKKYGIDMSLLETNLRLSPEERVERHQAAFELVKELEKARGYGKGKSNPKL